MIATDLLISLILAALGAAALYWGLHWRHPAVRLGFALSLGYLGAILFAFTFAGGVWLPPLGPAIRGVAVMPFFLTTLFISLLLASVAGRTTGAVRPPAPPAERLDQPRRAFDGVFIGLVGGLLIFAVIGYLA